MPPECSKLGKAYIEEMLDVLENDRLLITADGTMHPETENAELVSLNFRQSEAERAIANWFEQL